MESEVLNCIDVQVELQEQFDVVVEKSEVNLEPLAITENGTYYPQGSATGFSKVEANVLPKSTDIVITENGEYYPQDYDVDAFSKVDVDVKPKLEEITATDNGTYTPSEGFDGFGKVNVDLRGKVKVMVFSFVNNDKQLNDNGDVIGAELLDFTYAKGEQDLQLNKNLRYIDVSTWNVGRGNKSNWSMNWEFVTMPNLESIDLISWDFNRCTGIAQMFVQCPKLKTWIGGRTIEEVLANDIKAFKNLKLNFITTDGYNNTNLIDRASLRAAINGFADLSNTDSKTFGINQINFDKLTEEDIAILSAKNWTIAVK